MPVALLNQSLAFITRPFYIQLRIAVERVGAGLGGIVHLRAGLASVLAGVTVEDHRSLGNLVGAQRQVAGARVVQVEVRVHIIGAVHGDRGWNRRADRTR